MGVDSVPFSMSKRKFRLKSFVTNEILERTDKPSTARGLCHGKGCEGRGNCNLAEVNCPSGFQADFQGLVHG